MSNTKKVVQTLPSGAKPTPANHAEVGTFEIPATRALDTTTLSESATVIADTTDGSQPGVDEAGPDMPGYVVAHRYRLEEMLGRGAHGRVWQAEDLLAGSQVALKILSADMGVTSARIRREVASMRILRLSGVVQLLDEGTDGDRPFIVMERVHGTAFPGVPAPAPWSAVAPAAIALLETLARVHAVGVVHRDLKPANVLVDAEGRPTILDFGLAREDSALDEGVTDHGTILGTPAYLAPEQVLGELATARSDLYAVGVMMFEALSGRFPHPLENVIRMLRARVTEPPLPLASVASGVPRAVCAVVDALLTREPGGRPRSAVEVLEQLSGRHAPRRPALRRLGSTHAVDALVEAALAGRSRDVEGPRGSGRSRCLSDAAAELERRGRHVVAVATLSEKPSSSAPPTVPRGSPRAAVAARVAAASDDTPEGLERAIRDALDEGAIVIADDADAMRHPLAEALARCRDAGSVLRAFTEAPDHAEAIALTPLDEADLIPLFAGTSRLFHVPEDAARVLHRRTHGVPARVVDDVAGWVHAGLARWDDDRVRLDRDVIERLEAGLVIMPLKPLPPCRQPLPPDLDDLLCWIALAHPNGSAAHLALARGMPLDVIEQQVVDLEARGVLRVLPDGRLEPSCAPSAGDAWPLDRRREAHRRIAFAEPPGTPRRLFHLITGADDDVELGAEIAAEAPQLARRLAVAGRLGLAAAAVSEGLRAERRLGMSGAIESLPLLTLAVEIALEDGTPRALDRALYELYRVRPRSPAIERLAHLVRAALALFQRTPRALGEVSALDPFGEVNLERRRWELCVIASRLRPQADQEALLGEIGRWAASADEAARSAYAGWLGRMRYRQQRFAEAAELFSEAATGQRWATAQLLVLLAGASASMESSALDRAAETAHEARARARRHRLPLLEARAEWILRSVAYRTGAATTPDIELVEAAAHLGVADTEAMLALNEAAVAFRAGDKRVARDLGRRARLAWAAVGELSRGALLAAALELAAGGAATQEHADALALRALACPIATIAIPALGLVAMAGWVPSVDDAQIMKLAEQEEPSGWDQRLEVLSIREALDAVSARRPSPP